jgi:3-oxoacyl-(acyl-carrier-protein) synthase III
MDSWVLNGRGRIVFPSNFAPDLDFSVMADLDQLSHVIQRDFEMKAPTEDDIANRIAVGGYRTRLDVLRDVALNCFWVNRYSMTMYEKRPTRFGDLPRERNDVFLPVLTRWETGREVVTALKNAFVELPPTAAAENEVFNILYDVFAHRRHTAHELPALKPRVAEALADPTNQTWCLAGYRADYPTYSFDDIVECEDPNPELEALHRWAMVLHNQYPWDRASTHLRPVAELRDDDYVVAFHPRNSEVRRFLERVANPAPKTPRTSKIGRDTRPPTRPYEPVHVPSQFRIQPRIEALAVVKGEQVCTNDDLIRNTAYNWSPMSAAEIEKKTGIQQRLYTSRTLEQIGLEAAEAALAHAGREPEEIGAVIFCTCTSTRLIPSIATWISGELGMFQTQSSYDLVAACAGFPYGIAHAIRILQEVNRPVLLVCAEKFSDKIGTVRPSRMIFGDGAAAVVMSPADDGVGDIDYVQCYAGGPVNEVNSIIWPNPMFDNNITLFGPDVKALAGRYLNQMMEELQRLPHPSGEGGTLLDSIELVVPHQANKTMIIELALASGLPPERLYFNVESVGNVSAASIPIAIHDAITEGRITGPTRLFCPGFGAGSVGGYAVLTVAESVAAPARDDEGSELAQDGGPRTRASGGASTDVSLAFGSAGITP